MKSMRSAKSWIGLACAIIALTLVPSGFGQGWDPAPSADIDAGGDKTRLPVVFVHGQNGAGEQFERQAMHFTSNGYPATWVVAFDYSTARTGARRARGVGRRERPTGPYTQATTEPLDTFIDRLRERTGHDKVNLVGHSRGTFESAAYLSDPVRAAKIAHYATVGGGPATNPNGVASIAVSGLGDFGRGPSSSNGGKVAWMPAYQDHVMVCTSDESFWEIYSFFNDGEKPKTMKMTPEERPQVGGYVHSYINNMALPEAKVEVWEVASKTGMRTRKKPLVTLGVAEDGQWGPFSAKPGQHYEFVIHDKAIPYPRHYYREPFQHTNRLVYFRISADAEGYTASPFDKAPKFYTDKNAVFTVRHQNGSLLPALMTLSINGMALIVEDILPTSEGPRQTPTVGLYLADGNANGKSDLKIIEDEVFRGAFVTSADVFIAADPNKSVEFKLNDRVLNVPAWPGTEAGHVQIVFDDFR